MKQPWPERPGETPLQDISGLKLRLPFPTRAQVNLAEARNIQKAGRKYLEGRLTDRKAPFDLPWLKKLHAEMFGEVWSWAGKFRQTNLSIGADKHQVQQLLIQLLHDLPHWPEAPIACATRLHHRAVQIHPFENGNGRWARMLCNIWLRRAKAGAILWPVTTAAESPVRGEYLAALRAADGVDEAPLIDLHERYWREI